MPPSSQVICSFRGMNIGQDDDSASTIYKQTKEISVYVVKKQLGQKQKWNKIGEKMFELCTEMKLKHEPFFGSLFSRLEITRDNLEDTTRSLMSEVVEDGCNFGRIVSIFTLCMVLGENCYQDDGLHDKVDSITTITAEIVLEHREWFEANQGWAGFMNFFSSPSDKIWKGLVYTTVGLGAVAGLLYANS